MTTLFAAIWMTWGTHGWSTPRDERVFITPEHADARIYVIERRHERETCATVSVSSRTGERRIVRRPRNLCSAERFLFRLETCAAGCQEQTIEVTESEWSAYATFDTWGNPSFPQLLRDEWWAR